jgi:hypothetical protein
MVEPILKFGAKGDAVHVLQRDLNAHGGKLAVDGVFGPATLAAVKRFQKAAGIASDGIVGPVTWSKLLGVTEAVKDPAFWMLWFVQQKAHIRYGEVRPIDYDLPPGVTDCSGLVTCAFKRAKWADPNGDNYNGSGYTGTLRAHGKRIAVASIKRNDLVHYGNPDHVALYVGDGDVVSHGHQGDPTRRPMGYRQIVMVTRNH